MERIVNSPFALVDDRLKTISLYKTPVSPSWTQIELENVSITIDDCGLLSIKGDQRLWSLAFDVKYVEDLSDKPMDKYIKYRHKSILDLILKRKKVPYVDGWYRLNDTAEYESIMSQWFLIL